MKQKNNHPFYKHYFPTACILQNSSGTGIMKPNNRLTFRSPVSSQRPPRAGTGACPYNSRLSTLNSQLSALNSPLSTLRSQLSALNSPLSSQRPPLAGAPASPSTQQFNNSTTQQFNDSTFPSSLHLFFTDQPTSKPLQFQFEHLGVVSV